MPILRRSPAASDLARGTVEETLAETAAGRSARVVSVAGGNGRLRLAELGLRSGAVVTVVRRTAGGGRLLALGVDRVAVDHATAKRVRVEAL